MFVMGCYGHKLSNGVLFAHHLILDVPGGPSHLDYRRRVGLSHDPPTTAHCNVDRGRLIYGTCGSCRKVRERSNK